MFLSRMHLNPRRRGARFLLGNPQAMHAAVMSAFPPQVHEDAPNRVLWRVDTAADSVALYIVSPAEPSFEHVQEQAGWANQESWSIRPYGPVLDRLMKGQRYSFRLAANPVRTVTDPSGRKKLRAHITAEQQRSWLLDRADTLGVQFEEWQGVGDGEVPVAEPHVIVTERDTLTFPRAGSKVTIARAQFDGTLGVTDPQALRRALTVGVGRAKGYGCGLLTLAPAPAGFSPE